MIYGVILAAGIGKRMKTKEKKQFIKINNKPILLYSIDKFLNIKQINRIILVINNDDKNSIVIKYILNKYEKKLNDNKISIVIGGKERYDSVYNSLLYIDERYGINSNDKILIHDSARPNVDIKDINCLIKNLKKYKAITLGYKLSDSIKQICVTNNSVKEVKKSLNRDEYYLISTPQGFDLNLLYNCYNKFKNKTTKKKITDDLQIIEYYSKAKTFILDSSKLNYKITTKDDLNMLQYIL